ncbi:Uncharacterised protein [Elizabethkingia miricola]|uniref:Uncharacterized protein n=1 Tax=Chryseobacterium taichungense TaxID=295069 RepID=A0A1H8A4F7_9FLAO|nr:hypothetical protein SAMN05421856_10598 [Chryseobacterium taichungense]SPW30130.1 Uncharacterised protein [Elizabethkingia miricola]
MKPNSNTAHRFKQWAVSLIDRYGYGFKAFIYSANADSCLPIP